MRAQISNNVTDKIKRLSGCAFTETMLTPDIQNKFGYPKGWRIQAFHRASGEMVTIGMMVPDKDGHAELCMFTLTPTRVDVGVSTKSFGEMKSVIANTMLVI
jgi:hypothetical protein